MDEEITQDDIDKVRKYFSDWPVQVTDEEIIAELQYFHRDSHKHMLAARSIVRSRD